MQFKGQRLRRISVLRLSRIAASGRDNAIVPFHHRLITHTLCFVPS